MVDILPDSQAVIGHGAFSVVYKACLKAVSTLYLVFYNIVFLLGIKIEFKYKLYLSPQFNGKSNLGLYTVVFHKKLGNILIINVIYFFVTLQFLFIMHNKSLCIVLFQDFIAWVHLNHVSSLL